MLRSHTFSLILAFTLVALQSVTAAVVPGRYIVELSTEPVAEHVFAPTGKSTLRSAAASSHRTRVRAEQEGVRRRLGSNTVVLDTVDTVANAMFVAMSEAEAKQMANTPGVRRVRPVRTLHMLLDRAAVVTKVTEAWNQLPPDSAGAGVKIAIIDSGIDARHPGFQDTSLRMPDTFPRVNSTTDEAYTNNKVIVARSYVSLLPRRDSDRSAQDRVGHGTALAMIAAGVRNAGPLATITGIAPKAYLGNYKVFGTPGVNDATTDDAVIKALDDAVADGMDIVNLSLGYDLAPRLNDDPEVEAIEQATRAGVLVVVAAGNNGGQLGTIASPATAPSAIAVGASLNDRIFASTAEITGVATFVAMVGEPSTSSASVAATLTDVASLDTTGLTCTSLPQGSLAGRIAVILRGTCTFEEKLNNAQRAGALAALVYAAENAPDPIVMSVGSATLPAQMISYGDGAALKRALTSQPSLTGSLHFATSPIPVNPNRLAGFSAAGPSVDSSIKPDLVAPGSDMYVATQTLDSRGDMYDSSGYLLADGTSFSAPLVAGAAALLKSARPDLSSDQYRSLLINTAASIEGSSGVTATVQQAGAGLLNAVAALRGTAAAYPTALNFGTGGAGPNFSRSLKITNIGSSTETFSILVDARTASVPPAAATSTVQLAPGASADVPVSWQAGTLAPGAHEGFFRVVGSTSGTELRIPYWYAVASGNPAAITILDRVTSARRGSLSRDAILFRVIDSAGVPLTTANPNVVVVSGDGSVQSVNSQDDESPGLYSVNLRLGPATGSNVYRIEAGGVAITVSITGT